MSGGLGGIERVGILKSWIYSYEVRLEVKDLARQKRKVWREMDLVREYESCCLGGKEVMIRGAQIARWK